MKTSAMAAAFASAALFALAGCTRAPDVAERAPALVPAADTRSGPVRSRCTENFAILDRDRDRRISLEELAERIDPRMNPDLVFRQRDRDQDGFLLQHEFCTRLGVTSTEARSFSE